MLKINRIYLAGIALILALPLLSLPPLFFPPDWAKTMVFRIVMLLMVSVLLWQFLYKKEVFYPKNIIHNRIIWILSALFMIYFLSSIFSPNPYLSIFGSPVRSGGFLNFAFYILFAVFAFLTVPKKDYRMLWIFSLFVGFLVSLGALIQYYGLFERFINSAELRPSSTIGNPIFLGIYLLILLFPALCFAINEKKLIYKLLYLFYCLISFYAILITGSRAAYLGFLIGLIYFVLLYPKKITRIKWGVVFLLIAAFSAILYLNTAQNLPGLLENNRLFQSIHPRLSLNAVISESRFPAWEVGMKVFYERPVLGWGMENFSIGFNKHYDSSIGNEWWDKPHNILIQTATEGGVFALIAYIALFAVLFWNTQKIKNNSEGEEGHPIFIHGLQASLIAYLVANFFSIDSYPTYIMFFFIIAYVMSFSYSEHNFTNEFKKNYKKNIIFALSLIIILSFIWQYNIFPLLINKKIVHAQFLSESGQCEQMANEMEDAVSKHSFLDAHVRLKYIEYIKTCAGFYPEKTLEYVERGTILLKEASELYPHYPRIYIYLGTFESILALYESDASRKNALINEAYSYFEKAEELAPDHQEIFYERTKLDVVAKDYKKMREDAQMCIDIHDYKDCYWRKALSAVYLKNQSQYQEDVRQAIQKGIVDPLYNPDALYDLANAYWDLEDYNGVVKTYEQLVTLDPGVAQYHASLALAYEKTGQYQKARKEALILKDLMPEAKDEVDAFLKNLGQNQ